MARWDHAGWSSRVGSLICSEPPTPGLIPPDARVAPTSLRTRPVRCRPAARRAAPRRTTRARGAPRGGPPGGSPPSRAGASRAAASIRAGRPKRNRCRCAPPSPYLASWARPTEAGPRWRRRRPREAAHLGGELVGDVVRSQCWRGSRFIAMGSRIECRGCSSQRSLLQTVRSGSSGGRTGAPALAGSSPRRGGSASARGWSGLIRSESSSKGKMSHPGISSTATGSRPSASVAASPGRGTPRASPGGPSRGLGQRVTVALSPRSGSASLSRPLARPTAIETLPGDSQYSAVEPVASRSTLSSSSGPPDMKMPAEASHSSRSLVAVLVEPGGAAEGHPAGPGASRDTLTRGSGGEGVHLGGARAR